MNILENIDRARHHEFRELQSRQRMHAIKLHCEKEALKRAQRQARAEDDAQSDRMAKRAAIGSVVIAAVVYIIAAVVL